MIQTLALLLDSYRELNAKRLFWVTLALSAFGVALLASVGLSNGHLTVLVWTTPIPVPLVTPATFYKQEFVFWGVSIWLSWVAAILALISTAGIFPDLMAGGSIDLYLSKPIGRPRLFATKLLGGLLFVTLQVTVFCALCFVVLRARAGTWEPGLFVAVPLVVLMFSYLFAVCVLVGVVTRSTITALLLTLLFWLVLWGVQVAERGVLFFKVAEQQHAVQLDRQIVAVQAKLDRARANAGPPPATRPTTGPGARRPGALFEATLDALRQQRQAAQPGTGLATADRVLLGVLTPLPKTSGTIEVLERQLIRLTDLPPVPTATADADVDDAATPPSPDAGPGERRRHRRGDDAEVQADQRQTDEELRRRSATWILGTSFAFEVVVLGLAGWLFCRRDY